MVFIVVYIILFNFGETEADCLLPCPKYHNNFDCNFYNSTCFTNNESVSLDTTNEMMPARPENLQTKFFDNANITFTWNADTSTIKRLQGFLLNLTVIHGICKAGRNHFIRVFTYTNIGQIEKYKNEQFSLEENSLCAADWELELYSLPKGNCSKNVQRQILILPHHSKGNNASGSWQSSMTITYSYPLRNIEVNFTKAPEYFNFEKYNISLEKNNEIVDSRIIKKIAEPSVTFEVDTSGKYVVKLQPFSNDENRCLCRTKENKCKLCEVTSSHKIEFTGSKKLPKKYALLLCLNDHFLHDEAVQLLIKYLENFGVIVHHANKFGKCVFEVYDIVLLINSTALAERQKAWAEGKDYEQFFMEEHSSKLTNETFILIDELSLAKDRHKIISLKFDHTPDSPVFKHYPSQNGNFSIPRNLFDMVKSMVDVSIKFRGFFKKQALLNAISNAAEYEKCNKNWFSEKYGDPIPENVISSLNSKDRKSMKKNNNNFNIDNSINSCNVSELLHTLQKKNDQGMLLNFLNMNNIENSSILNV
ncbi:uncharacterized protein LOC106873189 isoform X2 [Octopus bimaculoides]|uniref:uncharacterized protein LOC106873189 isoform X2 n=1 Tax=Octopus bimaculoides TaxID=37653 RepID=UPI00071DC46E|nr:uncharacterized protein LOC106873189 isoform X2 [Octopus bimaculoides]|eukprot:XP_014775921.1 PREDICTED: uncharacterized protein LOC106873189 isoform X2 [Octopus bimaculoides]